MDNVFCPEENAFPKFAGQGTVHVSQQRPLRDRWGAMGAAEDCWHRSRTVMERKQFAAAGRESVDPEKLADMQTEIALA
jgi:glutaryl-CoA dehydrogenase